MKLWMGLSAFAATALIGGAANAEPSVEVRDAAVRVFVIPEARLDVDVKILRTNPSLPLFIQRVGDRVIVDGRLWPLWIQCRGSGESLRATILGKGDFGAADLPQIVVRTPMDARVSSGGVAVGSVGRSHSLELHDSGCGSWAVANVESDLVVRHSGSGDVEAGSVGAAYLTISGSGRLRTGSMPGQLEATVSGSGRIETGAAAGAVLHISGSGSLRTGAIRNGLQAQVSGSGDVKAASVSGPLSARLSGVGHLVVPAGEVTDMQVGISGVGDVDFGGRAQNLDATISGAGDVHAAEVTGQVTKHVSGSGRVHVGP